MVPMKLRKEVTGLKQMNLRIPQLQNIQSNNEQTNKPNKKTKKEEKQSKKDKNNNQENNLARADYTNKQTNQMEKRLLKEEDVQVAQVAMTDKTIFVALKMNHNHRPKIKEIARDIV